MKCWNSSMFSHDHILFLFGNVLIEYQQLYHLSLWVCNEQEQNTCLLGHHSQFISAVVFNIWCLVAQIFLPKMKKACVYWPMRIKEHSDEELAGGGLTCSISSSLKWLSSRMTWYEPPVSLVNTVHTRISADRPITETRTFRDFRVCQTRNMIRESHFYIELKWNMYICKDLRWLHLDQFIDIGWVTCGEAAEDYQDLPACMSRHVPSHKDRQAP